MREILFRGRSMAQGSEWLYGDVLMYENSAQIWETIDGRKHNSVVSIKTVGQYTGLTDKNGKKIFEGDICKHRSNYSGEYIISAVTYTDGEFLAMVNENSGFSLSDKLEVIGNIHDNPELLKGGE